MSAVVSEPAELMNADEHGWVIGKVYMDFGDG
jgi:hypothetical protein